MENVDTMIPVIANKVRYVVPRALESVSRARKAGVPMACGADYLSVKGVNEYGGKNCREMLEFTRGGFTPMEAIVCATKGGAMTIKREDDLGTLEAGKIADLIVVKDKPLENIACLMNTYNTKLVMKDGMAIMDGAWVTAMCMPAVTAVSAEYLCPDAESFGMFGCGVQGQGHVRFIVKTLKKPKKI